MNRPLRVFLCHSSNDKTAARSGRVVSKTPRRALDSTLAGRRRTLPRAGLDMEIEKAIEETDVIIVCLSNNSITKEGYTSSVKSALLWIMPTTNPKGRCSSSLSAWKSVIRREGCECGSMLIILKVSEREVLRDC